MYFYCSTRISVLRNLREIKIKIQILYANMRKQQKQQHRQPWILNAIVSCLSHWLRIFIYLLKCVFCFFFVFISFIFVLLLLLVLFLFSQLSSLIFMVAPANFQLAPMIVDIVLLDCVVNVCPLFQPFYMISNWKQWNYCV